MRAKVAVATVQGKAYFLIVTELKQRNISFLSLIPGESVPAQIRIVISTSEEKRLINHNKILIYRTNMEPGILGSELVRLLQGKENYEAVVVGIDPGEVFGLAVIADGVVLATENCFSVKETLNSITNLLKTIDASKSAVDIKIGNGVPIFRDLLEALDDALPPEVSLEIVGEAGTNRHSHGVKHGRGLRHMVSAMRIAARAGHIYPRRQTTVEHNR
jgi:hypothetical protein